LEYAAGVKPCRAIVLLVALLAGCRLPPGREMRQARADLAAASSAHGDLYSPGVYEDARRALSDADRMMKQKKYDDARLLARESSARSRLAISFAGENRARMLEADRRKNDATEHKLHEVEADIAVARERSVDAKRLAFFEAELARARVALAQARGALSSPDPRGLRRAADDADVEAEVLMRDVAYALAEKRGPPPSKR
jgi:hypothetical protein